MLCEISNEIKNVKFLMRHTGTVNAAVLGLFREKKSQVATLLVVVNVAHFFLRWHCEESCIVGVNVAQW